MSNSVAQSDVNPGILKKIVRYMKYIAVSYVISLILIVILSAIVCYTDVPESIAGPGVKFITFFGVFISALLCAVRASGKGWLVGGVAGVFNILILLLLGLIFVDADVFVSSNAVQLLCGFVFGAIGGIVGINVSKK